MNFDFVTSIIFIPYVNTWWRHRTQSFPLITSWFSTTRHFVCMVTVVVVVNQVSYSCLHRSLGQLFFRNRKITTGMYLTLFLKLLSEHNYFTAGFHWKRIYLVTWLWFSPLKGELGDKMATWQNIWSTILSFSPITVSLLFIFNCQEQQ